MSTDWFFLKKGWFGKLRAVGPLNEPDLLVRIDRGEIAPDTLLQSETKTRGRWVPMNRVGPAIKHYQNAHPEAPQSSSP